MNDIPAGNAAGASAQYAAFGYFVEFGGYTETPDPGYGGEEAPESAKTEPAVTVSDSTLKGPMQTFTFPEGAEIEAGESSCLFSQSDNSIVVDPMAEGSATVTLKPTDGKTYDQTKVNEWLASNTTDVTAKVNDDGSVTLTFTQASKYKTSGDMSGLADTTVDVQAKIGDDKVYSTVKDALEAATDGDTVVLQDTTLTAIEEEGAALGNNVTLQDKSGNTFKSTDEDTKVKVDATGKVTVVPGEAEAALKENGTVTVGETTYKATGETGAKLHITKGEDGTEKVELTEGSVEAPANKDITVKGKKVTAGEAAITATMNEDGSATVHVNASQTVTIDGVTYTGEADIVIGNDDSVSVKKGTVNLPSSDGGTANGETNVDFGDGKSVHVKNAASETDKDVTVTVPGDTEGTGKATVPPGGAVTIGPKDDAGKTYTATQNDTELEFDKNGDVTLKKGGVELGTGDAAVKFGGKDITATDGSESGKVKVETTDGEKAAVTVPKGGSVTIGDTTYTNTGDGELELEVDAEGNVTLKPSTGETASKVEVSDGGSLKVGDNTYTAKGNATIEAAKEATEGTLTEGTVALGENSKVKTKSAGEEVTVSGSVGLEVTAGGAEAEGAKAKVKGKANDSVTVEKGESSHSYALDNDQPKDIESDGTINGLAEALAESGTTPVGYYQVKKQTGTEGKNVFVKKDESGATADVTVEAGAKFSYGNDDSAYSNVGTYEVPEGKDSASLTADQKGNVTLNEGTVKVTPGTEKGKIKVGTNEIETDEATVTTGDGKNADIELENGKSITVDGKTYTAADGKAELQMDEEGNVTLKSGKVTLAEGTNMTMDGVTYTGEVTVEKTEDGGYKATFTGNTGSVSNNTTTYTPGESGGEATVDAEGNITGTLGTDGGKLTVDDKEYTSENSGKATVDKETGKVTLDEGSIKTPAEGGSVTVSSGEDDGAKDYTVEGKDVTVTKGSPSSAKVGDGGTLKVTEGENTTEYTAPTGKTAEVQLTKDGPVLKDGAVELDNGEAIGVNGATVETTADKVTVTKESDGGNATVDIPEGAKAKINGVEVEGPANVEIDSSGKATVTPNPAEKGASVVVDGVKYVDSSKSGGEGKVTIDEAGRVTAENMNPTVELPTGRIHVPAGQSVSFDDSTGGNTTVTGGDSDGCWIEVAEDGTVTVYEDNNSDNVVGTYKNEGKSDEGDNLQLTVSSESGTAELKGGTVRAEKDSPVKVGEHTYTPGDDGMTLKYPGEEDDNTPTLTDGSVIPAENAPVKVGDNTYTPQSNNVEIGMGTDNNGSVKSNDGEDAQVKFKGEDGTEKDYLVPGTAGTVNGTTTGLPSPAQEKLTAEGETDLGNGAKIKGDAGNGKEPAGDAFFESTTGGGNLTLQPGAKATVTPAGDEAGSKATTYENADPEKDAKLTLDKDGNATLTDGKVKMTGEGAEGKGASVTVNGNTITSKDATVTAPGKNAEGEEETGSADVTITGPDGKVTIGEKEYSASEGDLTLHVAPNGDVSLKEGKVGLADDSSIKFGNTDITNPTGGTGNVTVEATEGKANVTVPGGTSNSVEIGGKEYKNAGDGELKLEVDTNGEVYLNSGKVQVQDGARVTLPVNDGFQHFVAGDDVTVEKTEKSKYKVTVPEDGSAVFNSFEIKDHSGSGIELEITTNGAALTNGSADIGTNMELTVSNAKVKNAGPGDVTVTADPAAIDIPAGTTATVNGVEVKGPAKVTVGSDGKATVKPEPAEAGKSVTVGGVTYTDTSEDGSGKVEMSKDGTVKAENMSAAIEKLPVEGLVVPAGQTLTYKAGGKDVTLKGGASDSKIDIAANGDITMESGNLTIKGDVTTKKADDASEDTKWQYVGDVTLKLTDEDGKALTKDQVTGKLTVKKANGEVAGLTDDQIVVNDDGTVTLKDVPYGSYTVEVEGATGKKTTTTVTVNGASTTSSMTVETEITVTTEVSGSASMAPNAAENLEDEVKPEDRDKAGEDDVEVTITLNVADASTGKDTEKEAIDAEVEKLLGASGSATDAVTDYVDVTVSKEVTVGGVKNNDLSEDNISNTSSLITMRFPLSTSLNGKLTGGVTAENIFVFRYHDGSAAKMRKVSPGAGKTANFECYYIEVSPDSTGSITVVVKANKFSVYAFGVADSAILPQDPSTGGGGVVAYSVTLPEDLEHGDVSVNYPNAAPGVNVTLTVTPDEGYELDELTVTDRNGNIIPVTDNGDGTYSFTMPSSGVVVSTEFKLTVCDGGDDCPSRVFPDIDVKAWYHEYTDYVIETKLMQGSGGLFKPNGTLTRAEMVTVLWNMNGRGVVNYLMTYGDVSEEDWYAEAIRWATSEGVVDGYDNGNFGPNDKITREQMAKMLYNYEKKYGDGGFTGEWMFPLPFADTAKINDWAYEAVAWCYMNGVINGKGGNVFDPAGNALRCELAKVLTVYSQIDD